MEPKWWTNKPQITHSHDTTQPKLGRSSPLFPHIVYICVIHDGNYIKMAKIPKFPKWGYKNFPIFPSYNQVHYFVGS